MAMDFLARNWALANNPRFLAKNKDAIRFGLLGASTIAPSAVIAPAKSCADIIISAVAARDVERAKLFARKWGIERVLGSYQGRLGCRRNLCANLGFLAHREGS